MALTDVQATLKERVAKGLNFGIEAMEDILSTESPLYNEFILLKSKYNDLMYISSINTLPYEQMEVGLDRLRNNLLHLVDRLEEDSLEGQEVNPDLRVQALPTRRTNFFKLLDIHFKNLEDITYIELYNDRENRKNGRSAIFELYQMHRRRFRNKEDVRGPEGEMIIREHFLDFFAHESGPMEVYFKNIKHLLAYTLESEVERTFFLNTLKSLFTRFELATLHYYSRCGLDPEFTALMEKAQLIDPAHIAGIMIPPADGKD